MMCYPSNFWNMQANLTLASHHSSHSYHFFLIIHTTVTITIHMTDTITITVVHGIPACMAVSVCVIDDQVTGHPAYQITTPVQDFAVNLLRWATSAFQFPQRLALHHSSLDHSHGLYMMPSFLLCILLCLLHYEEFLVVYQMEDLRLLHCLSFLYPVFFLALFGFFAAICQFSVFVAIYDPIHINGIQKDVDDWGVIQTWSYWITIAEQGCDWSLV